MNKQSQIHTMIFLKIKPLFDDRVDPPNLNSYQYIHNLTEQKLMEIDNTYLTSTLSLSLHSVGTRSSMSEER